MTILNQLAPYAHWFLRLSISGVFIFHGVLKFMNLDGFSEMLQLSISVMAFVAVSEVVGVALCGGFGYAALYVLDAFQTGLEREQGRVFDLELDG